MYSQAAWILYEIFPQPFQLQLHKFNFCNACFFLTKWYWFPGHSALYTKLHYSAILLTFSNSLNSLLNFSNSNSSASYGIMEVLCLAAFLLELSIHGGQICHQQVTNKFIKRNRILTSYASDSPRTASLSFLMSISSH